MRKINVGLIGYGIAGAVFHAPLIMSEPKMCLKEVVTSRELSDELSEVKKVSDPIAMVQSPEIDLVVIASPNTTHVPLARKALLAGKDVVIDKPFTITLAQANSLIDLADDLGRLLTVFHNRRWDGNYLTVSSLLEAGKIQDLNYCEIHYDRFQPVVKNGWRDEVQPGSGVFFDLGPHLIDQTLGLFGMPERVIADITTQRESANIDDYFHLQMIYPDKRVVLHGTCLAFHQGPRFLAHGSNASLLQYGMDGQEDALKAGERPGGTNWGMAGNTVEIHSNSGVETIDCLPGAYEEYYRSIADAILEGSQPAVLATEARDVMKVLEAAQHSSIERRSVAIV